MMHPALEVVYRRGDSFDEHMNVISKNAVSESHASSLTCLHMMDPTLEFASRTGGSLEVYMINISRTPLFQSHARNIAIKDVTSSYETEGFTFQLRPFSFLDIHAGDIEEKSPFLSIYSDTKNHHLVNPTLEVLCRSNNDAFYELNRNLFFKSHTFSALKCSHMMDPKLKVVYRRNYSFDGCITGLRITPLFESRVSAIDRPGMMHPALEVVYRSGDSFDEHMNVISKNPVSESHASSLTCLHMMDPTLEFVSRTRGSLEVYDKHMQNSSFSESCQVYARCDDAYRLTASGDLNIPEAATDAYCSGPCLEETDLVLHCIDQIMNNFEFYNRATIRDIKGTIHDGCGQTRRRGHFDVSEHIQADQEDTASKVLQGKGFLLAMLCVAASLLAA